MKNLNILGFAGIVVLLAQTALAQFNPMRGNIQLPNSTQYATGPYMINTEVCSAAYQLEIEHNGHSYRGEVYLQCMIKHHPSYQKKMQDIHLDTQDIIHQSTQYCPDFVYMSGLSVKHAKLDFRQITAQQSQQKACQIDKFISSNFQSGIRLNATCKLVPVSDSSEAFITALKALSKTKTNKLDHIRPGSY